MKIAVIKKKLIKDGIMSIGAAIIATSIYYYVGSFEENIKKELRLLSRDESMVTSSLINSQKEYEEASNAFTALNNVKEHRLPTAEGYDSAASRIRAARPLIEKFKKKYEFTNLNVTFSGIEEDKNDEYKVASLKVMGNEMSVEFQGMSDELIFAFIYSVIEEFPGYVQLKEMNIERNKTISDSLIKKINDTATLIPTVSGRMVFTWKTLKGEPLTTIEKEDKNEQS